MRFKGTLALLIISAALGGYLYFYEIRGGEKREKAKQEEKQIWKLDSGSIQEIRLISPEQSVTCVRSGDKEWRITAPRSLEADSDELNRLASSAADLSRESVVEPNASELARFGLSPPEVGLQLKTKDGTEHKILFGKKNPTGNSTYACLEGKNEVFLVADYVASSFRKNLEDLRTRSILKFDQFEAQSLDLRSEKGSVQLVKEDDRWWIQDKVRLAADSSAVSGILGSLANTRLKEFFEDDPQDFENLGFENPRVEVRLTVGKDRGIKHLLIGSERAKLTRKDRKRPRQESAPKKADSGTADSELYVARDESRRELFFVEKDFVEKLLKSSSDLRDKTLATFQRWDIDVIVLKNSRGNLTFIKSGSSGDWVLGEEKKKTKWDAVTGILNVLEKPVNGFVDRPSGLAGYGLDPPAVRVVLKQGADVKVDCAFGKAAKEGVYAQVKGESAIKIADKETLDALDKAESDFIDSTAGTAEESPNPTPPQN